MGKKLEQPEQINIIKSDPMKKHGRGDGKYDPRTRLLIATATLGIIRMEWANARFAQCIPCNWSHSSLMTGINTCMPMGYLVADAQNVAVQEAIDKNVEWIFFHEDDVILPFDCFVKLTKYMNEGKYPVVSGLYYLKGEPSEPIVYRGRGNSHYDDWKRGDKVWVDGVPTGCLLVHMSVMKEIWKDAQPYNALGRVVRRVFETPSKVYEDPETGHKEAMHGTSDLFWCDQVRNEGILKKAGWEKIGRKRYPFLLDTSILCKHIDLTTGQQYPAK